MPNQNEHTDLIIVGGGVLGAFHAWHALQRGLSIRLFERHTAPCSATVRNFGQIVPSGMDLRWQQFGRDSLEIYKSIQTDTDISIRQNGSLYIASDDEELTLLHELHEINAANDYASELWSKEQCCRRYPQLQRDYCRGGLFFPEELSANPRQMIHRLLNLIAAQPGSDIRFCTGIRQLTADTKKVVAQTTDNQQFSAENAIVCCGSEFQMLFPDIFCASDIEAVKLQMLRLKPQPEVRIPGNILTGQSIRRYESFSECPSWNAVKAAEPSESFGKEFGIHILFKQETDGSIILGDSHEYAMAAEADSLSFEVRSDISRYFVAEGRKIFDLPAWDIETEWFGVYSQTSHPDGIFTMLVDDRIHIVTGIGGKGMTSSAGFARHYLKTICND